MRTSIGQVTSDCQKILSEDCSIKLCCLAQGCLVDYIQDQDKNIIRGTVFSPLLYPAYSAGVPRLPQDPSVRPVPLVLSPWLNLPYFPGVSNKSKPTASETSGKSCSCEHSRAWSSIVQCIEVTSVNVGFSIYK